MVASKGNFRVKHGTFSTENLASKLHDKLIKSFLHTILFFKKTSCLIYSTFARVKILEYIRMICHSKFFLGQLFVRRLA